jgi:hypothetical protein
MEIIWEDGIPADAKTFEELLDEFESAMNLCSSLLLDAENGRNVGEKQYAALQVRDAAREALFAWAELHTR